MKTYRNLRKWLMVVGVLMVGSVAFAVRGESVSESAAPVSLHDVVPKPASVMMQKGVFSLPSDGLAFSIERKGKSGDSEGLLDRLRSYGSMFHEAAPSEASQLRILINSKDADRFGPEGYEMKVAPSGITLRSASEAGAFYGVQSLRQLLSSGRPIGCGVLSDQPRFSYRGMHFDVSRHFRGVDFLKKQVDAMALLKLNRMHLHLTDAAGWRMRIDAFPRLTEFAAWRDGAEWMDWYFSDGLYCEEGTPGAYGGYYTKEELKQLVEYARQRHIEVIPEIEIPGHSREVTSAYPELGCSGAPYTDEDLCIGKEATFDFIEKVLAEVMEVFPSPYIHIGGDEASKAGWRTCEDCRRRMEAEGLADVDELQSYAIRRVEKIVNSHGRRIIGWDEILEGGLAPDATVMSWRGTEGGISAMEQGHDVVMTPGAFCYLDYCQDAPFKEPSSIGGYTPLEKVYSYEPLEGIDPSMAHHLLGLQANLWTEYIPSDSHAEYMYYPRAYAIAETAWSPAGKDYDDFRRRALTMNALLSGMGYKVFDLEHEFGQRRESLHDIHHAAMQGSVNYVTPYSEQYPAGGDSALIDGVRGGWLIGDRWQGFLDDMELVVDLHQPRQIHYIGASFMNFPGAWVHLPVWVEYSVSEDGVNYELVERVWNDLDPSYGKILMKDYAVIPPSDRPYRYVKLNAKRFPRKGGGAWLFIDELIVN